MNQKNLVLFFLLFIIGTIPSMAQKVNSYKLELEKFEKELEYKIIQPTYKVLVDSDDIDFEGFTISSSPIDQPLELYINNDTIVAHQLMTQNNVEDGIQQVDYANALLEVNYYRNLNILMFLVHFYPCTGLGCGVNYQIVYDLKTKKHLLLEGLEPDLKWNFIPTNQMFLISYLNHTKGVILKV